MVEKTIPADFMDLFQKCAFAQLATVMPDGSPQVTTVWVDYDGTYVLVNTSQGRQKERNVRRDARVAIAIQDPDDAYRLMTIRGRVVEVTAEGGYAHIDKMARKYIGQEKYPWLAPGEVRVILKIKPEKVTVSRNR